jgi:phage major head subunit gpT-like protein
MNLQRSFARRASRRQDAEAQVNLSQRRSWHVGSAEFAELVDLDPVLEAIYFQQYAQVPQMLVGRVVGVRTSDKAKETDQRIGSFEDPQEFNGQVYYTEPSKDYEIVYAHTHLTLGFKVERTMLEDQQYAGIFDKASNLGQSFARKRVKDEASIFNNAFTVVGYDGKSLVATDHPRSKTDATAVDNSMGTAALTDANLEAALVKLESLGDDRGELTNAMGTTLLVGRANRQKALQLTGSDKTPEDGNNSDNTHDGLQTIVHPAITGKKWFVLDGPMALMTIKWINRLNPIFGVDDDVSRTLMRSFFGRMRYSFGWSDFRAVVGSNPS